MAGGPKTAARVAQGALMGAANTVPGVSGGTLALMFGIYERLIGAIRDGARAVLRFVRGDLRGGLAGLRAVDWALLLPLAAGAFLTVVLLAGVLETGLEEHPEAMAGLFLGLVVASIVVSWRLPVWDPARLALMSVVGVGVFAVGAVLGLALFASLLTHLLERHHDTMLAVLIGLMVGSLRVLWPWPNGVGVIGDTADTSISGTGLDWPPAGDLPAPLLLAAAAFGVVLAVDRFARSRA